MLTYSCLLSRSFDSVASSKSGSASNTFFTFLLGGSLGGTIGGAPAPLPRKENEPKVVESEEGNPSSALLPYDESNEVKLSCFRGTIYAREMPSGEITLYADSQLCEGSGLLALYWYFATKDESFGQRSIPKNVVGDSHLLHLPVA